MSADLMTVREVAEVLRCSTAHVYKLVHGKVAGTPALPVFRNGRKTQVLRASLCQWMNDVESASAREVIPSPHSLDSTS
jgi:excisionase family DNA binding protein